MNVVLGGFLLAHGAAHLAAFSKNGPVSLVAPRHTALGGLLPLGRTSVRAYQLTWVLAALAYAVVGCGVLVGAAWAGPALVGVTVLSLALCLLGWPESKFGAWFDLCLLAWLATRPEMLFPALT